MAGVLLRGECARRMATLLIRHRSPDPWHIVGALGDLNEQMDWLADPDYGSDRSHLFDADGMPRTTDC